MAAIVLVVGGAVVFWPSGPTGEAGRAAAPSPSPEVGRAEAEALARSAAGRVDVAAIAPSPAEVDPNDPANWVAAVQGFRDRLGRYARDEGASSDADRIDEARALVDDIDVLDRGRAFLPGEAHLLRRAVIERAPLDPEARDRWLAELPPPSDFRAKHSEPTPAMRAQARFVREQVARGVAPERIEADLDRQYMDGLGRDDARR